MEVIRARTGQVRAALALAGAVALLLVLFGSQAAYANSPNGGDIISNGLVELGVNAEGHLNWYEEGTEPSWTGTSVVGLRYMGHDVPFESTADGCTCEGWGIADATTEVWGGADDAMGIFDVALESFSSTETSADSVVLVPTAEDPVYRVTHNYSPSEDAHAFQVDVTIENLSDETVDVRYLRSMDWDTQPTPTREVVTIVGGSAPVDWMSDNPFATPNPLEPRSNTLEPNSGADWVDSGPADHGGVFSFDLGELGSGESVEFTTYYGAAPDKATAQTVLLDLGVESYSLGVPTTEDGLENVPQQPDSELGVPVTFFFGFSGVGGDVVAPPGYPAAPSATVEVVDDDATLEWAAPDDGGSPLTGYELEMETDDGKWSPVATPGSEATSFAWEDLPNGDYRVRIAAVNETGRGPWRIVEFTVDFQEPEEPEEPEEPSDPDAGFIDLGGSPFLAEIEWLADRGITEGCNPPANDRFCPESFVTRAEIATFLDRYFGLPGTDSDFFSDDDGHVLEAPLNRTAAADVFRGCNPPTNSIVCPDDVITRAELAAVLVRAFGVPAGESSFGDAPGHLFESEIGALEVAGITKGCNPPDNDRFCADRPVTRGEAAAFLYRTDRYGS